MKHYTLDLLKNKFSFLVYLSLCWVAILSSCTGSGNKAEVNIPGDASWAGVINLKNMTAKEANWKEIMNEKAVSQAGLQDDLLSESLLGRILEGNVDVQSTAYFFGKTGKDSKVNYAALFIPLTDAKEFDKIIQEEVDKANKEDKKIEIKSEEGLKYLNKEDKVRSTLVWNDKMAILMNTEERKDAKEIFALAKIIKDTKKEESLLEKNSKVKEILSQTADAIYWINQEDFRQASSSNGIFAGVTVFEELSEMTKAVVITVNFENGQVVTEVKTELDVEKSKKYESLFKNGPDASSMASITMKEPALILGLNLDMPTLYKILEEKKGLEDPKKGAEMLDVSLDDIFKMLSGSVVLSAGNLKVENYFQIDEKEGDNKIEPEAILTIGIADSKIRDRVIENLMKKNSLKKEKDYYYYEADKKTIVYVVNTPEKVFVTLNPGVRDMIQKGTFGIDGRFKEIGKDAYFINYLNIGLIASQIPKMFAEGNETYDSYNKYAAESLEAFDIQAVGIKNGEMSLRFILSFKDKNSNALKSLLEIARKARADKDQKKS